MKTPVSKDRKLLAEIIKSWAQDHTKSYTVMDYTPGDQGVANTSYHFSWVIRTEDATVDLLDLLNRVSTYVENIRSHKGIDGMFCCKCNQFYDFAESNQEDGSMICYSCRNKT